MHAVGMRRAKFNAAKPKNHSNIDANDWITTMDTASEADRNT
jgi:hypothetical protein